MSGDLVARFASAIAAASLSPPDSISADGAIHRFSTNGRRGDDSGWYIAHTDGTAAGAFGCWRAGLQSSWCAKSDSAITAAELADHRQRIKAMQAPPKPTCWQPNNRPARQRRHCGAKPMR